MASLLDEIAKLEHEALERIGSADSPQSVRDLQISYLGRKGPVQAILKQLGGLPPDERKQVGAAANRLRQLLEAKFTAAADSFETKAEHSAFDPTLPGTAHRPGTVHIINQVMGEMCRVFYGMGFETAYGPHVETDYYNFEALNFPPDHPARDMQDTFFVEHGRLLRTHTTPVQPRVLEQRKPPIKVIMPGKTFRNEAISTRAHVSFHQVDGFLVDEGVSMGDLKGVLVAFCKAFFGGSPKLKLRPSYFPFTEPSMEVDIQCFLCGGEGCQLCKFSGWLEILGCGMIHPNILRNCGYDSEKYTGWAFGIGVERIAMLKYKINDIRLVFNNNVRFLRQFS
jgi:phenylalanyl-tRNA synthetase alpha chain